MPTPSQRTRCGIGTLESARLVGGDFEIRVQLGPMLSTVAAPAGLAWNADPTRFVPDSTVDICASADEVIVDTRDGKDFRGALARLTSVAVTEGATTPAARPSAGAADGSASFPNRRNSRVERSRLRHVAAERRRPGRAKMGEGVEL